MIDSFSGENFFLSNFFPCSIVYKGLTFNSVEAAFQSMKCEDVSQRALFCNLSASEAKKLGRKVKLTPIWELIKTHVMYELVYIKFTRHYELQQKLLATSPQELIESNTWGDTFWGTCNRKGANHLGKLIMEIREHNKVNYCTNPQ